MPTKTTLDAVKAAQNDNPAEFQSIVNSVLSDKINDAIGVAKFEVAGRFFKATDEAEAE